MPACCCQPLAESWACGCGVLARRLKAGHFLWPSLSHGRRKDLPYRMGKLLFILSLSPSFCTSVPLILPSPPQSQPQPTVMWALGRSAIRGRGERPTGDERPGPCLAATLSLYSGHLWISQHLPSSPCPAIVASGRKDLPALIRTRSARQGPLGSSPDEGGAGRTHCAPSRKPGGGRPGRDSVQH